MTRVTATEFKNNIGTFSDAAMLKPVIITSHQRDRLVLMSAEEYQRLIKRSEIVTSDFKERLQKTMKLHDNTLTELAKR